MPSSCATVVGLRAFWSDLSVFVSGVLPFMLVRLRLRCCVLLLSNSLFGITMHNEVSLTNFQEVSGCGGRIFEVLRPCPFFEFSA